MTTLITGAAGFIGMHTALALLENGETVVGYDNMNDYYDVALKELRLAKLEAYPRFTFYRADITDYPTLTDCFAKEQIRTVIHLAAQAGVRYSLENPHAYIQANVVGFTNVMEAARRYKAEHVIYASSSSVYGGNEKLPFAVGDDVSHPVSLYAATKKANELIAHTYSHLYDLPTTGLRFFTVYGPYGRPDMAYFSFAEAIMANKPIRVYNHGDMMRDFTYIDDIVNGITALKQHVPTRAAEKEAAVRTPDKSDAPYRIYNIGNHQPVRLGTFIATLEQTLGKKAVKQYVPMQPGDVPATYADITELQALTGFQPATSIDDGLRRFAAWYLTYKQQAAKLKNPAI
ncbi:NAD-dependent epimerase [Salisediminibacterium halotolerans]|uniref:UDP-glucuronate 4-epimerase n=1 Tax=Salisediminibacterium halotolerans TaxID=517425 RepID=A0A1H9QHW0_9BACI|nr:NAD-dependent epimerase [Salisediminibacterium haloalkalitolerans]SER60018.1 UDP-glucuronate 4-epimerase [Salisediminibacterium haloalkalitolerans]